MNVFVHKYGCGVIILMDVLKAYVLAVLFISKDDFSYKYGFLKELALNCFFIQHQKIFLHIGFEKFFY